MPWLCEELDQEARREAPHLLAGRPTRPPRPAGTISRSTNGREKRCSPSQSRSDGSLVADAQQRARLAVEAQRGRRSCGGSRGVTRCARLGEQPVRRRAVVLEVAAAVADREAHVAGCAATPSSASSALEVRVVAVVEDDEAGVDVVASPWASRRDACCVWPPGVVARPRRRVTSWRRCSRCAATRPATPAPTIAILRPMQGSPQIPRERITFAPTCCGSRRWARAARTVRPAGGEVSCEQAPWSATAGGKPARGVRPPGFIERTHPCPKPSSSTRFGPRSGVPSRARWPRCGRTRPSRTSSTRSWSATRGSTPPSSRRSSPAAASRRACRPTTSRRIAVLLSDKLGQQTNGSTVSRYCASGLDAIRIAANDVVAGQGDTTSPAGVEFVSRYNGAQEAAHPEDQHEQLQGNERPARRAHRDGPDRRERRRALRRLARAAGRVRPALPGARGGRPAERRLRPRDRPGHADRRHRGRARTTARGPRRRSRSSRTLEPAFKPGGTVTAGNSCPLNDGAAAAIVMSDDEGRASWASSRARGSSPPRPGATSPSTWASRRSARSRRRSSAPA